MIAKVKRFSKCAILALALCPQIVLAEGFTSADVLEWSEQSQSSYFQTSVTMIGIVATQTGEHDHIAECIDGWMGGGAESHPKRAEHIRSIMEELPDFHPQAVILAIINKECGAFN